MIGFREAFPDLSFAGAADLIAEGDYVVGRWVGGGTHTGAAFSDFLQGARRRRPAGRCGSPGRPSCGSRTAGSQRKSAGRWADGVDAARPRPRCLIEQGTIVDQISLDDGGTAALQRGLTGEGLTLEPFQPLE
jgi:hypothetical protein